MPNIEANKGVITQINVFTVKPGNQQALVDLLIESANFVKDMPGWMSASIHVSSDSGQVVNYAQSENYEAHQKIVEKLRQGGFFARNKLLAEAHPALYQVVYTLQKET
jgi:antibiotic biosynthesis monooxygenase (ABM) superfamily enzyme